MKHPYRDRARDLRTNATPAERRLWNHLRTRPLGFEFRRQHPIHRYILDVACLKARIAIEVDGKDHERHDRDFERDAWLGAHGWEIARYTNEAVAFRLDEVVADLERRLRRRHGRDLPAWWPAEGP